MLIHFFFNEGRREEGKPAESFHQSELELRNLIQGPINRGENAFTVNKIIVRTSGSWTISNFNSLQILKNGGKESLTFKLHKRLFHLSSYKRNFPGRLYSPLLVGYCGFKGTNTHLTIFIQSPSLGIPLLKRKSTMLQTQFYHNCQMDSSFIRLDQTQLRWIIGRQSGTRRSRRSLTY